MKRIFSLLQPYLLATTPLVVLFRNNPGEIFVFVFLIFTALFIVVLSLLFFFFFKITKDQERTSISLSFLSLALILSAETSLVSKSWIWSLCVLFSLVSLALPISPKWKTVLSSYLSLPLLFCLVFNLIEIGSVKRAIQIEIAQQKDTPLPEKHQNISCDRDIYLIILDEFISEHAFNNYYHFDNGSFFQHLRKNNFHLVSASTSNYPWTITSIASLFNFDYHSTQLPKNVFTGVAQFLIKENKLFQILKNEGYSIHHIPSIYWMGNPSHNPISDCLFRTKSYGLLQTLSQITPWKNSYRAYQRNSHREHVLHQLEQLKSLSEQPGKKLGAAHIMCPHRPITFTEEGGALTEKEVMEAEKDSQHRYYLAQSRFISKEVMKTVDHILEHSLTPPLILLFSDHGKFPIGSNPKGKETLPLEEISWRFSNLQALYLPGFDGSFPNQITPINTIRMILNHYFGYHLPILEDACCPHFYDLNQKIPAEIVLKSVMEI